MTGETTYFYSTDSGENAQWNQAGRWPTILETQCECVCPPPALRIGCSQRVNGGGGFGEWSDWDYSELNYASLSFANNFDATSGGSEVQSRIQFEITGNGRAGVVRYRLITSVDAGSGDLEVTNFTPGEVHNIMIAEDYAVTVVEVDIVAAIGQVVFLSGAPGRALGALSFLRQEAGLRKKGFRPYYGDSDVINIFRGESVNSGGDPGCALPAPKGKRVRVYSGHQVFSAVAASPSNNYTADPAGTYTTTLSANLVSDKYASTRFDRPGKSVDFGTVSYGSPTVKNMVQNYDCGGNPRQKSLQLILTNPYPTSELTAAVDGALDAQAALGANAIMYGLDPAFSDSGGSLVVHKQWLSTGEVWYQRVRTTSMKPGAFDLFGDISGATGGAVVGCFADPGASIGITITCEAVIRDLIGSGGGADARIMPGTFDARLYAANRLTGGNLEGNQGRAAHAPDVSLGEDPIVAIPSPYELPDYNSTEIVFRKVKVRPHAMLNCWRPFVEDTSVIDEGYDGTPP